MNEGLYPKYTVIKNGDGSEVTDCFVLVPVKDKAARKALITYAEAVKNTDILLSNNILKWIEQLEAVE